MPNSATAVGTSFVQSVSRDAASEPDPPREGAWDFPLHRTPLVFFDLELTGDDPSRDEIVEVAAERVVDGHVVDRLTSLVRASFASCSAAQAVHGIDPSLLESAPGFESVAPRLCALFRDGVPVAHGTALDLAALGRSMSALGLDAPRFAIDTTMLARRALALKTSRLRSVHEALRLGAEANHPWHRAEGDMRATRQVFEALAPRFEPVSARDLWEVRAGQLDAVRVRAAVATKLETLLGTQERCALVVRARARDEQVVRGVVERWDSPHALVRDARNRLHLVRADRILRFADASADPRPTRDR